MGSGARDGFHIEAGLPLYGHELDGPYNISPFEAGYGWAVKLDKEFFIGKAAMEKISKTCKTKVARIELSGEKGVRPVRQNDAVIAAVFASDGSSAAQPPAQDRSRLYIWTRIKRPGQFS